MNNLKYAKNALRLVLFEKKIPALFKEGAIVSFTEYLMLGALFGINIILNRYYDTAALGTFTFAYTIAQISMIGIGGALTPLLRREIVTQSDSTTKFIINVLQLKIMLLVLCLLISLIISFFLHKENVAISYFIMAMIFVKGMDSLSETFYTSYQSVSNYRIYAYIKTFNAGANILGVFILAYLNYPVQNVYIVLIIVSILFFLINFLVSTTLFTIGYNVVKEFGINSTKKYFFNQAWPLIVNSIFFQISSRVSVLFVFAISGKIVSGVFSGAVMMVTVLTAFANALGIVFFPRLTKLFNTDKRAFFSYLKKISVMIFFIGLVLLGVFIITLPIQFKIFGQMPDYARNIFLIAGCSIPLAILSGVLGNIFVVMHKQKLGMYISFILLIVNSILYYIIPTLNKTIGVSLAYLLSNLFIVGVFLYFISTIYKKINFTEEQTILS